MNFTLKLKKIFSFLTILFLFSVTLCPAQQTSSRPKIALVLSGGGAKGLAEIPLLETLEEKGIPVDIVLGTSMGSMLGALYAAGYTPKEIKEIFTSLDIISILNTRAVATQRLPQNAFSIPDDNIFSLNFTWTGIGASPAILGDQNIMNMLAKYFSRLPNNLDFDSLPKKYRAIATNITNAEKIVYSKGSLPDAIRGSMSLPAIWTPAIIDRNTFVMDGGWVDNLPIQEAIDMGADIIIAMDVASYLENDPLKINSIDSIAINLFNLTISTNAVKQHHLANILFRPELDEYSTLDFLAINEIIAAGEKCIQENMDDLDKLVLELKNQGVPIIPQDKERSGEYSKLAIKTIESIKIKDISYREEIPLPKESDFKNFIGKSLTDETISNLIEKLNDFQNAYSLSSLSFAIASGSTEENCCLEIRANHYTQKSNRIIFGGEPSATLYYNDGYFYYDINPNIKSSIYLATPFPMMLSFFNAESIGLKLTATPRIAYYEDYSVSGDLSLQTSEGSAEPKNSPFYEYREANDDFLLNALVGIKMQYANMFTHCVNFQYDFSFLHSNLTTYNLFSIHSDTIWNTIENISTTHGSKVEFSYAIGLSYDVEDFLYKGQFSLEQRFAMFNKKAALGYTVQAGFNHFPWQLNCGYLEYGGFNGMPGYTYGTKKRDISMIGINYTHKITNVLGMPLYAIAKAKIGIKDTYNPYTSESDATDSIFYGWNPSDISQYDFGAGLYMALKTPVGHIVLGGGGTLNGNFCIFLGLM